MSKSNLIPCLLQTTSDIPHFQPQAEDILTDEDLLELFRIIKQIIRKKPDAERIAKLLFCIVYAMGDLYHFYKPIHSDCIVFRDESNVANGPVTADVQLHNSVSCCQNSITTPPSSSTTSSPAIAPVPQRLLSVSYLTNPAPTSPQQLPQIMSRNPEDITTDQYSVRPYTNIRPMYASTSYQTAPWSPTDEQPNRYPHLNTLMNGNEILMEPKQRGFYYQDGRITREPASLQKFAEQGVLTHASLMKKRKKADNEFLYDLPSQAKKPKIPHRHGEFKQRRKYFFIIYNLSLTHTIYRRRYYK